MRKFTIDPERVRRFEEARDAGYHLAREASAELRALLDRKDQIEAAIRGRRGSQFSEPTASETQALRQLGEKIELQKTRSANASEAAQHHGRIFAGIEDYAGLNQASVGQVLMVERTLPSWRGKP